MAHCPPLPRRLERRQSRVLGGRERAVPAVRQPNNQQPNNLPLSFWLASSALPVHIRGNPGMRGIPEDSSGKPLSKTLSHRRFCLKNLSTLAYDPCEVPKVGESIKELLMRSAPEMNRDGSSFPRGRHCRGRREHVNGDEKHVERSSASETSLAMTGGSQEPVAADGLPWGEGGRPGFSSSVAGNWVRRELFGARSTSSEDRR